MTRKPIFVGRKAELKQFDEALRATEAQAVLVVGQQGMGKTMLLNKMAEHAENHPDLKCGRVRYEVTPTDSVDSVMELMLDHAYEAARVTEKSLDATPRRLQQWRALLNLIKVGDLWMSLVRDPKRNTRDQFLERLQLISDRMPQNGRAIFIIDPEKYVQEQSDQSWRIVIRRLPPKIQFVFAQRPEDALASSHDLCALHNVRRIPGPDLDVLDQADVEDLIQLRSPQLKLASEVLRAAVAPYQGHPYAVTAALDLIENGLAIEGLPADPTPQAIAKVQWKQVCANSPEAIRLFKAYAILEVAVPNEVVEAVSELDRDKSQHLLSHPYLAGLLRQEAQGRRIYHCLLADHIRSQLSKGEAKHCHTLAAEAYRQRFKVSPEAAAVAAMRLPLHVLESEGPRGFVHAFVDECTALLLHLGLHGAALALSSVALKMISPESREEAAVRGNLGVILRSRGDLQGAEREHRKALSVSVNIGWDIGVATSYGGLGAIYRMKGDLQKAEEAHRNALKISEQVQWLPGMADAYGSLGLVHLGAKRFEEAESLIQSSLRINRTLRRSDCIAGDLSNLGLIYQALGQLGKAEQMHTDALELNEKLARPAGVALCLVNLAGVLRAGGDLDGAEAMLSRAFDIEQGLQQPEGIARCYADLALIQADRGDHDKAERLMQKAVRIYAALGIRPDIDIIEMPRDNTGSMNNTDDDFR